jgi:methionyl-tRNA formyltransferase
MKEISIVFMGTPEFAVESLSQILSNGYIVTAVVTVADKPAGRGLKLKISPVKEFALSKNIPVLQPLSLKDPEFISTLKTLHANLFVIVAFRKLPEEVWSIPELGSFNLHASLLPQYRGAAPINHAILNGETETGATTFFLNAGIDTGTIIMNERISIGNNETAGELHDRLKVMGAELVVKTIRAISEDNLYPREQPGSDIALKGAPRLFREHCQIEWDRNATDVHNHIRGLSPYPGAFSVINMDGSEKEIKLLRSEITDEVSDVKAGDVRIVNNRRFLVACSDYFVEILQLQPSGKKTMKAEEYIRGLKAGKIVFINPLL